MLVKVKRVGFRTAIFRKPIFALFLLFGLIVPALGQTAENTQTAPIETADEKRETPILMPVLTEYKGIKIGTSAEAVRDKLGKAKIDDKDGFFYDWDEEIAQIRLDAEKNVLLVAVTYSDKNENSPKFADVFGSDVPVPAQPDGSIYKLVRYPEAGYWVSYSRTAGEKPRVTVMMQKL